MPEHYCTVTLTSRQMAAIMRVLAREIGNPATNLAPAHRESLRPALASIADAANHPHVQSRMAHVDLPAITPDEPIPYRPTGRQEWVTT